MQVYRRTYVSKAVMCRRDTQGIRLRSADYGWTTIDVPEMASRGAHERASLSARGRSAERDHVIRFSAPGNNNVPGRRRLEFADLLDHLYTFPTLLVRRQLKGSNIVQELRPAAGWSSFPPPPWSNFAPPLTARDTTRTVRHRPPDPEPPVRSYRCRHAPTAPAPPRRRSLLQRGPTPR